MAFRFQASDQVHSSDRRPVVFCAENVAYHRYIHFSVTILSGGKRTLRCSSTVLTKWILILPDRLFTIPEQPRRYPRYRIREICIFWLKSRATQALRGSACWSCWDWAESCGYRSFSYLCRSKASTAFCSWPPKKSSPSIYMRILYLKLIVIYHKFTINLCPFLVLPHFLFR